MLAAVYEQIQNRPYLKRLAVRLMMRMPRLGARLLGAAGGPAADPVPGAPLPADPVASARYARYGYRYVIDRAAAEPAEPPGRRMFVDISGLLERDARTGIQRVVRNLTYALASLALDGWRVEPVYLRAGRFHYAREFAARAWRLPATGLPDAPISARPGDVFFTADLALLPIKAMHQPLRALRSQGVRVAFVLHDLIPVFHPEFYQGEVDPRFARWLDIVLSVADDVLCVSAAVADELRDWLAAQPGAARPGAARPDSPRIGWFHLGAELSRAPAASAAASAIRLAAQGPDTRLLLMVGTLEPRKGHEQVLDAMERLWAAGADVNLLIIGKVGWNVQPLVRRLRAHPQAGARLCWLERASDADLSAAYSAAHALVAASAAEGFGLPLIEAAQHGLPIIARDIPVFREVAGAHAWYFRAGDAAELATSLTQWLALERAGAAPTSVGMPFQTWERSARQVTAMLAPPVEPV